MSGMMDEITRPSSTERSTDLRCLMGSRFVKGILDSDTVSIVARVKMVILERISAVSTSPGNHPAKLVINAVTSASVIMNALLLASVFMSMRPSMR